VHVLVLRLRYVQLLDRKDISVHEQVWHGAVLEFWRLRMYFLPRRHVQQCKWRVQLHELRCWKVSDDSRPSIVHKLRLRHV
jgi:hypothetical protein